MKISYAILVAGFLTLAVPPAWAQSPADLNNAAQQSERLQRQQQMQQQEDINRSLESAHPETHIATPPVPSPQGHGEGCHEIKKIVIENAPLYPADERKAVATYEGHCLGVDHIQKILGGITAWYLAKGFVTTRVYLPTQDLSTGTLRITVIEGTVGGIRPQNEDHGGLEIPGAFPFMTGNVMNLRDFEQGLDQINRLASNNATLDIEPGAKVGESVIVIKNEPSKRWHVNVSADDYGDKTTGRDETSATAGFDNLLGVNDYFSLTGRRTFPLADQQRKAASANALFSVPFGYATFTGGYSMSDYDSEIVTPAGTNLHLNGTNRSGFVTLDDVVYRDQGGKANVSATLTRKSADNFAAGQKLTVSSRTLTVLDLSAAYTSSLLGGFWNSQFTYSRGLGILGPLNDPSGLPDSAPRAQFDKLSLNFGWVRPIQWKTLNFSFSTQWNAQYAFDPLYGSEQLSIGGIYTVRGFYRESLANDNGFYTRNDFTLRQPLEKFMGYDASINPYLAIDAGAVGSRRVDKSAAGTLLGTALGFTWDVGPYSLDFYGGRPITAPKDVMDHEGFNMFTRLSMNF